MIEHLIFLDDKQKQSLFADLVIMHLDKFKKDVNNIDRFAKFYPEWSLGFAYVDDLKKMILEERDKNEDKNKTN